MDKAKRTQFNSIIHKETLALGESLYKAYLDYAEHFKTRWPLVTTPVVELLDAVRRQGEQKLGCRLQFDSEEAQACIMADRYSMILTLLFLQDVAMQYSGAVEFVGRVRTEGNFVHLDITWKGPAIPLDHLQSLQHKTVAIKNEGIPLALKEILGHHEAEIWSYQEKADKESAGIKLLFPYGKIDTVSEKAIRSSRISIQSRPEFYDFDLFHQSGQTPELDSMALDHLTFTVFDTETTGLDPAGGDEIVSIAAIRVVNGRILKEEVFDQLVDPRRSIPERSTQVHGIHPEMVAGQPTIDRVLPLFHKFAEETILVAHNAAFDMKMLQLKEEASRVVFNNPVLDTMLLSEVVHPAHKQHTMEAIAGRLGVSIVGRHTALGDALATAEVFLKLMELLKQQHIRTLGEARRASERTYNARLSY
jgi:DNA polymerase-3 subunit epsilon